MLIRLCVVCACLLAAVSSAPLVRAAPEPEEAARSSPLAAETISAGGYHTCGILTDGTLACWGENWDGQATPPGGTFTQVSASEWHSCAIKADGTPACWGRNDFGQATPPDGTFAQVSAGDLHTCAIKTDGTLACWGSDSAGQATPPGGTFAQVSADERHTCAIRTDGTLACWGENSYGQAPRLSVSPDSLPNGTVSVPYSQALSASGGAAPYTYLLGSGALPPGLDLGTDGLLSGTPTTVGSYSFTVHVVDSFALPLSADAGPYGVSIDDALAVMLAAFTAQTTANAVALTWETVSEIDNAGFNLYRSHSVAGAQVRLNDSLIPSHAPGGTEGGSTSWLDRNCEPGAIYFYWLEAVSLAGQSTRYGPASALCGGPTAVSLREMQAMRQGWIGLPVAAFLGLVAGFYAVRRRFWARWEWSWPQSRSEKVLGSAFLLRRREPGYNRRRALTGSFARSRLCCFHRPSRARMG